MIYIFLNILFSSFFILGMRWLQAREYDFYTIGMLNYIVAAIAAGLWTLVDSSASFEAAGCITGAVNGIAYFVAFFFLMYLLPFKGAALTAVLSRLSVLMAVVLGIVAWGERPNMLQALGIGFACLSLVLIGNRGLVHQAEKTPPKTTLVLALFLLIAGSSRMAQETFKHMAAPEEKSAYLLVGFALAAMASVVVLVVRKRMPSKAELLWGSLVGITNVSQTGFILKALENLDGFIVFPVASAGGLLFTSLVAVLMFRERLAKLSYWGIGLAVCSLAMLSA